MIQIGGTLEIAFPESLIAECQKSRNQIVRRGERKRERTGLKCASLGNLTRSEEKEPTLLEVENPEPFRFYDNFEVSDFSFSQETGKGHLKADISLLHEYNGIEIQAHILDMKNRKVIAEIPAERANHTNTAVMEHDFMVSADARSALGVIAFGKWGNNSLGENELAVFKEANTSYPGVTYIHKYPKKEGEAVVLGHLEGWRPQTGGVGDADHIVIALTREPRDRRDVDYICGAARIAGLPNLCVPGEGTFKFPAGESPEISQEYPNTAVCKLYRKSGGVSVIAQSEAYALNNIRITPKGNTLYYQFMAWGQAYKDPAEWRKTEFDYCLELTLHTKTQGGDWIARDFTIDTRNPKASITDEVLSLEVMYGCVAPETGIRMADGGEKEICRIEIGETVMGKNGTAMKVTNVWRGRESDTMVEIFAGDSKRGLLATKMHPVWVKESDGTQKWKRACECGTDDCILMEGSEEYRPITEIREHQPCEEVYNLDLMPLDPSKGRNGTMYCNGILTGDNQIQNGEWGD